MLISKSVSLFFPYFILNCDMEKFVRNFGSFENCNFSKFFAIFSKNVISQKLFVSKFKCVIVNKNHLLGNVNS